MKKECSIVKDLLPLYLEDMVSEDTASFIEKHLNSCDECKMLLNTMKTNTEENIISEEVIDNGSVIKNVKSKLKKRKFLTILLTVVLTFSGIFAYFVLEPSFVIATVDYGHSNIYTKEDMDSAVDVIKDKFHTFEGCTMYKINYAGDKYSKKELHYINNLAPEGTVFTECIVFETEFRSPLFGGGAWNANSIYYWTWHLGRTNDGPWQLLTWGYA